MIQTEGINYTQNTREYSIWNTTTEPDFEDRVEHSSSTKKRCQITLIEFILYFCCQPVICLCGFLLNIVNVMIFCKPQFSGAAYTYMIAMSMADAITLLIHMPAGLVRCSGYFPYCKQATFKQFRTVMLYYTAYVLFPLDNIFETVSVWLTVLLAIERYMAMSKLGAPLPLRTTGANGEIQSSENIVSKHRAMCLNLRSAFAAIRARLKAMIHLNLPGRSCLSRINCKHSIILVTILSVTLHVPYFFVQSIVKEPSDSENVTTTTNYTVTNRTKLVVKLTEFGHSKVYQALSWIRMAMVQGIPLVFLCIANFCLFHFIQLASVRRQQVLGPIQAHGERRMRGKFQAHRQSFRVKSTANNGSTSRWQMAQRKLTSLLIVIVALFLAGQIPQAFAYVAVFGMFNSDCVRWSCCKPYQIYRCITTTLRLTTYSVNFFVYLLLNKHFKNQLKIGIWSICAPRLASPGLIPPVTAVTSSHLPKSDHLQLFRRRPRLAIHDGKYSAEDRNFLCVMDMPSEAISLPARLEYKSEPPSSKSSYPSCTSEHQPALHTGKPFITDNLSTPHCTSSHTNQPMARSPNVPQNYCSCILDKHRQTEIFYGDHYIPLISKSFRTYFSHDTVMRKVTIDHHHREVPQTMYSEQPFKRPALNMPQPCAHSCSSAQGVLSIYSAHTLSHSLQFTKPQSPNSVQQTTNSLVQANKSLRSTDSNCSLYQLVSSLIYEESDFDVISVDESVDPELYVTNTAV